MGKNGCHGYDPPELREMMETIKKTFGIEGKDWQVKTKQLIVEYAKCGMESEKVMVKYGS